MHPRLRLIPLLALASLLGPGAPRSRAAVAEVVVVFKTHFDLGYTDMASNVVQRYRTSMIDSALDVIDHNRTLPREQQFVWTLPGWPMAQIAADWPGQLPARRARVLQTLREGRLAVHALPFTTHTELLEPEDLVRGLAFASRLSREVSLDLPRDARMTDVPSHSWILPTLLRHAGVEFLHLGCNAASRSPDVPRLFLWEGPDGSQLLTMYTAESYGTGLVPPSDWPYRTWLALMHTGDNHGPPTPQEVAKVLADATAKLPGVKIRLGRLSDFADAIRTEKPRLPIVRADMPDTWIHGPMSDPQGAALARTLRPRIAATESLATCLTLWTQAQIDPARLLAAVYEQSLLYGEHTWGGALSWAVPYDGSNPFPYGESWKSQHAAGRFARLEASWEEHTDYIRSAAESLHPVANQLLEKLAAAVQVDGLRITVFNPLPWRRDGWVVAPAQGAPVLQALDYGELVPTEPAGDHGDVAFLARDLPPLGYRTFALADPDLEPPDALLVADESTGTLENAFFQVVLDPDRACVRSIYDKRARRELVDTNATPAFGQLLYERFSADDVARFVRAYVKIDAAWATNELGKPDLPPARTTPYKAATPRQATLSMLRTAVGAEAFLETQPTPDIPFAVALAVRLERDQPYVQIGIELVNKPADPWPEAGWICLPFAVESPRFRLGRLGGIVDPAKDIVPGANRHLLALHSGLTASDPSGWTIGLCAAHSPLVSLDQPGCWKYSRDFIPRRPHVYVNLFNNQWTTNFRLWNEGSIRSLIRIWSHAGSDPARELIRHSWETRMPLEAASDAGPAGSLPPRQAGLELGQPGILVTAFGPNPDGPGLRLRLWEMAGRSGRCSVRLPTGSSFEHAQPLDLRGRPTGPALPIRSARFAADLKAFAPASFALLSTNMPTASGVGSTPPTTALATNLARRISQDARLSNVLARAKTLLASGFNAGSGYREVWIRDFATFIELSCQVRPHSEIKDNLRLFFQLQADDGNIIDGFVHRSQANVGYNYIKKPSVPDYWGHKNTVETDQESSLVQAVHTYVTTAGDRAFLQEAIDGQTVLRRLERALEYLTHHRWSPSHGLLWGATTVDWGDVQPEHEWGVELDDSSHRCIDIYDNAMFLLAIRNYLALAGPDHPTSAAWQKLRDQVQANVRKHLWDPVRQKFIPHLYLQGSPFPATLDEHAITYHGGTAVAIQAGLLNPLEIQSALTQMRANVRAAGAGSIGLTVYPPYPAGTFKNLGMGPWSYQNGGDWDWFGGRMIQALIENGFIEDAYLELQPMLDRVLKHNGFHEWWDRANNPKGSGTFRGAAGVLGKAILMLQAP